MTINGQQHVGTIAATVPQAEKVFQEFGIDYYCHGEHTVDEACANAGADQQSVIGRIEELQRLLPSESIRFQRWDDESAANLVHYLTAEHQELIRQQTGRLATQLTELCSGGIANARIRKIREVYRLLCDTLLLDIEREEHQFFPLVTGAEESWTRGEEPVDSVCEAIVNAAQEVVLHHAMIAQRLQELRLLADDYSEEKLTADCRRMINELHRMEAQLHHYMHLENNILVPRALALVESVNATT